MAHNPHFNQRSTALLGSQLLMLGGLYVAQGLPFGLFQQALPVLMRRAGLSLPEIGLASWLAVPWALKFMWAPWLERVGSRRSWIIGLQLSSAMVCLCLSWLDLRAHLQWIMLALFVTNLLSATQDIATDGLAVEILDTKSRGIGNGVQVAGYRVGMVLGGGALLILFDITGWAWSLRALCALLLLCTLPLLRQKSVGRSLRASRQKTADFIGFLREPGTFGWMLLVFVFKIGEKMANRMVQPLLVDRGLSMTDIAWLLGVASFSAGLLGALLGGLWVDRIGFPRAMFWFGLIQTGSVLSYLAITRTHVPSVVLYGACVVEHLTSGMGTAALFSGMMARCRKGHAGTDYALQASLQVMSVIVAATVGGLSASYFGYFSHFCISAAVACLGSAGAWWWSKQHKELALVASSSIGAHP